jgi:hypothetical protein
MSLNLASVNVIVSKRTHFMVTGFNASKMTDKLQYSLGKVVTYLLAINGRSSFFGDICKYHTVLNCKRCTVQVLYCLYATDCQDGLQYEPRRKVFNTKNSAGSWKNKKSIKTSRTCSRDARGFEVN